MCKAEFLLPNFVLIILGILLIGLLLAVLTIVAKYQIVEDKCKIGTASFFLFCIQVYINYNILFSSGWEVYPILKNAELISNGRFAELDNYYFSIYPNNQIVTCIFACFYKVNNILGVFDANEAFFLIVLVQCGLCALTGKILFQIIMDYTQSDIFAWFGWGMYAILIALSGWSIIPYTDMMGLIFPIAVLRIYQTIDASRVQYLKWFGIFMLSFWGFKIKPQAIIIFVALALVEGLDFWGNINKKTLKKTIIILAIGVLSVLISLKVEDVVIERAGFQIDEEANLGALHIMMMGLNSENNGVWYGPDVDFSKDIPTRDERTAAQLQVIKQRMSDYGFVGLLKHLHKKTLTNFNDGTFAWGQEGGFFKQVHDDKNEVMAPFLKNVYYKSGSYYGVFSTIRQMYWLVILTISIGCFVLKKDKLGSLLVISLLGIMVFTYMFEARARYLILYVPFWIIVSCIVLHRLYEYIFIQGRLYKKFGCKGRSVIQECNGSVNLDLISRDSRGVFYAKI